MEEVTEEMERLILAIIFLVTGATSCMLTFFALFAVTWQNWPTQFIGMLIVGFSGLGSILFGVVLLGD
jgi:hypothetical protein